MQKVLLKIKGTQTENGPEDYIEFITEGWLYKNADGYMLEYDESELTGIDGVKTKLILQPESITLLRSGALDTHLIFSQNSVYESNLSTPYGSIRMSIMPLRVESSLSDQSGTVNLEYEINMGELSTVNKLNLSFKSVKDCIH